MKDFDFDEIDKAVAGALASDPIVDSTANDDTQVAEPVAEAPEEAPAPVVAAKPTSVEAPSPTPASAPSSAPEAEAAPRTALAARRSSGRFMDVVHPSSDMRGRTTFTPPATQVPATGETVAEQTSATTPATEKTEDEFEDWAKPLESPFLPDAKVEKRPLGGIASSFDVPLEDLLLDEPDEPRLEAPDEPRLEAPDEPLIEAHTMPDPIDFAAHSNELLSEKEDTGSEDQPAPEPVVGEDTPTATPVENSLHAELAAALDDETPVEAPQTPQEETPEVTLPEPQSAPKAKEEPVGPTSITQQYTEQPSSAEAPGAIYDTEAYHQPVSAPPKKKSGIWVVLWIFLLIVLGAGAGVVFYLFVLPLL